MWEVECDKQVIVYRNLSDTAIRVHVGVDDHCGGNARVTVLDDRNDILRDTVLSPPGGVVTYMVNPTQQVQVGCFGGTHPQGRCKVSVSF